MTQSSPVAASDELISALAARRRVDDDDPLVRALQAWAQRIDSHPVAPWTREVPPVAKAASSGELARRIVALTAVLTLSSSGLATAVTGDPMSTLHFVKREIGNLRGPDDSRILRRLDGLPRADRRDLGPQVSRSLSGRRRPPPPRAGSHVVRHRPSS